MGCYRLYFLTDAGHIRRREDIIADSDWEAQTAAAIQDGPSSRELWFESRLVRVFGAPRPWLKDAGADAARSLFSRPGQGRECDGSQPDRASERLDQRGDRRP